MILNKIKFFKMSGAGNTFVILDLIKNKIENLNRAEVVKKICSSVTGVGADGFVFLEESKEHDFQWDFYNNDGSHAEACGNASRCVVKFFSDNYKKNKIKFNTAAGVIAGEAMPDAVSVQMPEIKTIKSENDVIVNTGVPHLIIETPQIEQLEKLKEIALKNRYPASLDKAGANVTFVEINNSKIKSITFERGVEDFTQACGTGAVAAAFYSDLKLKAPVKKYDIQVPGGLLTVDLGQTRPLLMGPATYISEFNFLGEIK